MTNEGEDERRGLVPMKGPQSVFSDWYQPEIAYITGNLNGLPGEIKERLARRGWQVTVFASEISEAFENLAGGKGSILLIEDSEELPASQVLRAQLSNPAALLTPTIVACSPRLTERNILKEIGSPEIIDSPMNPMKFIESLEWLIRRWNTGNLSTLLKSKLTLIAKGSTAAMKMLGQLVNAKELLPLTAPCIAQLLKHQNNSKVVEKTLLNAIRENPRNVGVILATIDFYLHAAMPATALKIIGAAKKNHGHPAIIIPEEVQTYLMLNQVERCIPLLQQMCEAKYMPDLAKSFLTRCQFAEGYTKDFMAAIDSEPEKITQFKSCWHKKHGVGA